MSRYYYMKVSSLQHSLCQQQAVLQWQLDWHTHWEAWTQAGIAWGELVNRSSQPGKKKPGQQDCPLCHGGASDSVGTS